VERGWSIAPAGSVISIVLWVSLFSVPFGGFVADRMKRPQTVLVAGCMIFAGLMLVFSHSGAVIASVVALGLISGQPAGPMMSLPRRRASAYDPRDRHGAVLHGLLCRHDAGADRRRRLCQVGRQRRCGIRLRRRRARGLPAIAVGV